MRWPGLLVMVVVACAESTDAPAHRSPLPNELDYCPPTLDTPTALGLSGGQLLALYGAPFETGVGQYRYEHGSGSVVATDRVRVEISYRQNDEEPRGGECSQLAVPVYVSMRGAILDERINGVLFGSPERAYSNFSDEHLSGTLQLERDGTRYLSFTLDGQSWGGTR